MWRGPIVLVLVLLAFGVGVGVGLFVGERERVESALVVPQAAAASTSHSYEPALTAPTAPAPTLVPASPPSARASLDSAEPAERPAAIPIATVSTAPSGTSETNGSIAVQVVDARGAPVPGAAVSQRADAVGRTIGSLDSGLDSKLYADSSGRAVLRELPFGTYRVIAETDELAPGMSDAVRVSSDAPHASAKITLTRGGDVVGELHDIKGARAAAIQLSIHPSRQTGASPISLRQVYTQDDGTFVFERLPPGPYKLYTRAKGADEQRVPAQSLEVEVVDGQKTRVQFKDISASAVQVSGQVVRNGQPVARARVTVGWADFSRRPPLMRNTEADAQGRFALTLDEGGEYRFSVSAGRGGAITMIRATIPQVAHHELALSFATGSISGRVLGTNGDPLPGVSVRAMSPGKAKSDESQPTGGGAVTTDGAGRYTFADLPAGSYRLGASPAQNDANPLAGWGQTDVVVLAPGAELRDVDVRLSTGGAVEGRVQRRDGTPVGYARIETRGSQNDREAAATAKGEFTIGGLRSGPTWLRALSEQECSPWTPVTVAAGQTARVELAVVPGTCVQVEVEDASGPVATAFVSLSDGNAQMEYFVSVSNGKGRSDPVPPGTYAVTARRDWREKDASKISQSTIVLTGAPEQALRLRLP